MNKNPTHIKGVHGKVIFCDGQFSFILGQVALSSISRSWGINEAQHFLKRYPTCILSCWTVEGFCWPVDAWNWPGYLHHHHQMFSWQIQATTAHDTYKQDIFQNHTSVYLKSLSQLPILELMFSIPVPSPDILMTGFLSSWNVTVEIMGINDCCCLKISPFQLICCFLFYFAPYASTGILAVAGGKEVPLNCESSWWCTRLL